MATLRGRRRYTFLPEAMAERVVDSACSERALTYRLLAVGTRSTPTGSVTALSATTNAWLARDVIARCWWSFLLVLAEMFGAA